MPFNPTGKLIFLFAFFLILSLDSSAQTVLTYNFQNNFGEVNNFAPPLTVLGTGNFTDESLPDLSCLERTVYSFTQNSGLQYDNIASGNIIGNSYSIESYFKFTSDTGFFRIIDFKNRTSNYGLYATSSELNFFDELAVNTNLFVADEYVHLVLTRNGNSEDVNMYLNGMLMGTFADTSMNALPGASQVINFFQDDLIIGNEAQPGNIALLKLYNYDLDSMQVLNNYNQLKQTTGPLSIIPDTLGTCFNGNVFNFTNTSQPSGSLTYSWDFGDGNSGMGSTVSHSYLNPGTYSVYLIGDDSNGCIDTAEVEVDAYTVIPFSLGPDFGVCLNEQALIDAGSGFASYLWSDSSTAQVLVANQPGSYSVTVTDSAGCSGTDSILVFINPDPVFSLGTDTTICFDATLILNAPDSMESYLWNTGSVSNFIIINSGGVFSVEITNYEGCSASDTIVVTENPDILVSLGNDTTICDGQSLTLDPGSGFQSYQWNIGATTQTIDVIATAQYIVTVTDSLGCTKWDDIVINVIPTTVVDLGPDVNFCGGDSVVLDAGPGFLSYLWNDGSTAQTLTVFNGGTYSVTVSNGFDCDGTDSILVHADPFVTLGADFAVCVGDSVLLNPGLTYSTYLWSNGATTQSILVPTPGIYTLTVTDSNGCINSTDIELTNLPEPVPALADSLFICNGDTTELDAGTGFINYLWNDGSVSQTINVFTAGIYSVTVTDLLGCTGTGDLVLSVLPSPVVDLGPDYGFCFGDSTVLDGGAGANSYLWNDGSTNQFLPVSMAGTYILTITDSLGCMGVDSVTISMFAIPVVDLGSDTTICSGDSLLLDAGTGFSSYLWNDGSVNQFLSANMPGNFAVIITDSLGCMGSDSINIGMLAVPVVNLGPDTTICFGDSLQLNAGAGFNSYTWNDGSTAQTLYATFQGTFNVTVIDTNGCTGFDDILVDYFAPVLVPSITQIGNTLQSSSPAGNQWYNVPGGLIPGATGSAYTPPADGTYFVVVTDSNGCVSQQSQDFIFIMSGIKESASSAFNVYPNPTNQMIQLTVFDKSISNFVVQIVDITGKVVYKNSYYNSLIITIDLAQLEDGVYFVQMVSANSAGMKRLVVQKN